MTNGKVLAILLSVAGTLILMLALIDCLAAKLNASNRPYLSPRRIVGNFVRAIGLAWRDQTTLRASLRMRNSARVNLRTSL